MDGFGLDHRLVMDEVNLIPARSKSKSKSRPSSSRTSSSREERQRKNSMKSSPPSPSIPRSPRLNLGGNRTASAPFVPLSRDPNYKIVGAEIGVYSHRDSVNSVSSDPFFRNYSSPHSVSLVRELRSAAYSVERSRDAELPLPPLPGKDSAMDSSVNLPVRIFPFAAHKHC